MNGKQFVAFGLILTGLALGGCNAPPAAVNTTATAAPTSIPAEPSATPSPQPSATSTTAPAMTAVVITVIAAGTPPVPVRTAVATPTIAAIPGGLSPTALKYRILAQFGTIFFCDPDLYPVAREVPPDEIARRVDEIKKMPDVYQAILQHLGLSPTAILTSGQTETVYNEYKKLNAIPLVPAGNVYQFTVRVGSDRQGTAITGTIDPQANIAVTSRQQTILICPICLAAGTRIATPSGEIVVQELRVGMSVWTLAANGERRAAIIQQTVARPLPPASPLVHLTLSDGRELDASPAHPTADGRPLGSLLAGDRVDGATVTRIEWLANAGGATYDILPDGATGVYWANGVLLKSTLAH